MFQGKQYVIFRDASIKCTVCEFEFIEPAGIAGSCNSGFLFKKSRDMEIHTEKTNHKNFNVTFLQD